MTWSHKQGELNRADRAPFDVSVKREADGNSSPPLLSENDDTEDWANMNVFVDDHDATVTSIDGTVKNNTGKNLVVQAFPQRPSHQPEDALKPDAQHRFDFAGTGNTIRGSARARVSPSRCRSSPMTAPLGSPMEGDIHLRRRQDDEGQDFGQRQRPHCARRGDPLG